MEFISNLKLIFLLRLLLPDTSGKDPSVIKKKNRTQDCSPENIKRAFVLSVTTRNYCSVLTVPTVLYGMLHTVRPQCDPGIDKGSVEIG